MPPLLAGLDSGEPKLVLELIGVLAQAATGAVPRSGSCRPARQPPEIRRTAIRTLSLLLEIPADRLPTARVALTREAERYYNHQEKFVDPASVVVWHWDAQHDPHIVAGWPAAPTFTASQAEEYYGAQLATQALDLDPTYEPAQVVLLSLGSTRPSSALASTRRSPRRTRKPRPTACSPP